MAICAHPTRTGASGYIGGQVLHDLAVSHPELTIRALVRDSAKAQAITTAFPSVQTVDGTLDDVSIIGKETAEADIILRMPSTSSEEINCRLTLQTWLPLDT